ncbi:permease subunit, similiar to amino acid transporter subunit [Candidatus Mycoplasma haematolamae str. Purdue]|uniref:Permease subunit, similiar to amino acid transporter subunit n=1 Tax=Mycoplasma haematolamae (strain Purdue) TaxID=1212765 RepID=I7CJK1_MYCHA|nr:amino acid permease [Candidatus Mycoplasma haematolamae]AFO52034.1 permease subunit, similiar to amino acid transporter subunit [Candidatus Mycoplasma haematolamae str. Purdue]
MASLSYQLDRKESGLGSSRLFIISVSSMLGVGIFIKSKTLNELAHFSTGPLAALFILAAALIIALIYVFTKLVNQHSLSGRSFVEWVERYCGREFKDWVIRYVVDFGLPIGLLTTSIYLIHWINGDHYLWVWESSIVAFLLTVAVISLNVFSFRLGELLQRCLYVCMFIALIYVASFGIASIVNGSAQEQTTTQSVEGLNTLSGWTILVSGLPSIFFMYDGFYSVLSLKDKARKSFSFKNVIFYSFIFITLLYFVIIVIALFGDKKTGDFLKFHHFTSNKHLKDVLIILVMLTFLSSLNVASICGTNQLLELHYKYDFVELQRIRRRLLNKGIDKMRHKLESRLSVWLYIMKRMLIFTLCLAGSAQIIYWLNSQHSSIFWSMNEMLAELNSLMIFFILGAVVRAVRNEQNSKLSTFLHYFTYMAIYFAFWYWFCNNTIWLIVAKKVTSAIKLFIFSALWLVPLIPTLKVWWGSRHYAQSQTMKLDKLNSRYSLLTYSAS